MSNNQAGGSNDDPKKKESAEIKEAILGGLKSYSGTETARWINNLANDQSTGEVSPPPVSKPDPHAGKPSSMVSWAERLFNLFLQYEVEFNRTVSSPELVMETEPPEITPYLLTRLQKDSNAHFQGRLHIHSWTLFIRGNLQMMEGFVFPSEHFIPFTANEAAYQQFFLAKPIWDPAEPKLNFGDALVTQDFLPSLAKQLFGTLVRIAKGELSENTRFVFGSTHIGSEQNTLSADYRSSLPPGLRDDSGEFSFENVHEFSQNTAKPESEIGLAQACDLLIDTVDKELESLSAFGAQAFKDNDLLRAEKALKISAKLKSLREKMQRTVDDWKKEITDE